MTVDVIRLEDMTCAASGRPCRDETADCRCERCDLYRRGALAAAAGIAIAVGDLVRDEGRVPAGIVFAALQTKGCTAGQFRRLVDLLRSAGVVREDGDVLTWVGPR